jgi:predicted permease
LLISFAARFTARAHEITLDGRVLLFSLGISVLTGITFGSIPALFSQSNPAGGLKEGLRPVTGRGSSRRIRSTLVIAQVAVSLTLMFGAGLLLRSFYKLTQVDPGFHSENVISMLVDLDFAHYEKREDVTAFQRQLMEKVNANPFVVSSAFAHTFPLNDQMMSMTSNFAIEGRERAKGEIEPTFDARSVSPAYFQTLGIPLERGRFFTEGEGAEGSLVAIINHSMARHYWGAEDPIGHRVSTDGKHWVTIVGIVGDVKQYGLDKAPADEIYVTQALNPTNTASLLVRTRENPSQIVRDLVAYVYALDPNQPVAQVRTLEQVRENVLTPPRLTSALLGCFALLALVITAAGIAGVMGLTVGQRTKEIGIRMALGASAGSVLRMVLRQGMTLILVGMAAGLALVFSGTQLIEGMLFGIEPTDPITLASVTILLLAVAALACYGPARRATTVDPLQALRAD